MCALGLAACGGSPPVAQTPPPTVSTAPAPAPEAVTALPATEATPDVTAQPTAVATARPTPSPPRSTPTAAAVPQPTVAITARPTPPIITVARVTAAPALTPVAETTPTPTPRPPGASVGRLTTTREIDGLQRPGDPVIDFKLGERIYISVEFIGVRAGTALGFRWSSPGGCQGAFEKEEEKSIRRGFFGFFIDDANCVGRYAVDITVDGESMETTGFNVERP